MDVTVAEVEKVVDELAYLAMDCATGDWFDEKQFKHDACSDYRPAFVGRN